MSAFVFAVLKINGGQLGGLRTGAFDPRERDDVRADDGTLHQTSAAVMQAAPRTDFSTVAVRSLAAFLTGAELPYLLLDGTNGVEMIGAKQSANGPGWDAGTVHPRRKFASGLLALNSLRWSPGDLLEASCSAFAKASAGGTDPVVRDLLGAPSIPVNAERLVLQSVSNGLTKIASIEIAINHQIENNAPECYDGGLPFPTNLRQPGPGGATEMTATIETTDLNTAVGNGSLSFAFRSLTPSSVGLGATGVNVSINGAFVRERPINHGTPARRRIEIRGLWDGVNRPLTLTVV